MSVCVCLRYNFWYVVITAHCKSTKKTPTVPTKEKKPSLCTITITVQYILKDFCKNIFSLIFCSVHITFIGYVFSFSFSISVHRGSSCRHQVTWLCGLIKVRLFFLRTQMFHYSDRCTSCRQLFSSSSTNQ